MSLGGLGTEEKTDREGRSEGTTGLEYFLLHLFANGDLWGRLGMAGKPFSEFLCFCLFLRKHVSW